MTVDAQFCCILRAQIGLRPGPLGNPLGNPLTNPLTNPLGWKASCRAFQAAGALRETTQARSHDPTAQPQR